MKRILIANKEPIRAKGMETVLQAGGLEIAGVCHDVCELFEAVERCTPDIAILDMSLLNVPEVVYDLRRLAPRCQLVMWPELTPGDSPFQVVEAIQMMASFSVPDLTPAALVDLACNPRERQMMTLLGYGLNNSQIASSMGLQRSSVDESLDRLSNRLGTQDRYDLALYGLSTLNGGVQ